jgi:hypothetical protein
MPKYWVRVEHNFYEYFQVEADNETGAYFEAREKSDPTAWNKDKPEGWNIQHGIKDITILPPTDEKKL